MRAIARNPFRLTSFFTCVTVITAQLLKALRYNPEGRGFDSRWFHCKFSLIWSFRPHYLPGVDSTSNSNEYREYFLGR